MALHEQPKRVYTCRVCGGIGYRRWTITKLGMEDPDQPILHTYVEDWQDDPHNFEPIDDGVRSAKL